MATDSENSTEFASDILNTKHYSKSDVKQKNRSNLHSVCEIKDDQNDAISKLSLRINDIKDQYKTLKGSRQYGGLNTPNTNISKNTLGFVHTTTAGLKM